MQMEGIGAAAWSEACECQRGFHVNKSKTNPSASSDISVLKYPLEQQTKDTAAVWQELRGGLWVIPASKKKALMLSETKGQK